jgi:hypothetical protein
MESRVAIVVAPEFVAEVERVARGCPVWVTRTPQTDAIASHARELGADVTVFGGGTDPEAALAGITAEVELHHGARSTGPQVNIIEVLGTPATEAVREQFAALGFARIEPSSEGFLAYRSKP